MQRPKYAVMGGEIISKHDGDTHFVNAEELMRLYRIDLKQCVTQNASHPNTMFTDWAKSTGHVILRPDPEGVYKLPELNFFPEDNEAATARVGILRRWNYHRKMRNHYDTVLRGVRRSSDEMRLTDQEHYYFLKNIGARWKHHHFQYFLYSMAWYLTAMAILALAGTAESVLR